MAEISERRATLGLGDPHNYDNEMFVVFGRCRNRCFSLSLILQQQNHNLHILDERKLADLGPAYS